MPEMTYKEQLEVTKIYSVAGLLDYKEGLIKNVRFEVRITQFRRLHLLEEGDFQSQERSAWHTMEYCFRRAGRV